jgi:hypothetical protein
VNTTFHLPELVAFVVMPLVVLGFVGPLVAGLYLAVRLNGRRPAA